MTRGAPLRVTISTELMMGLEAESDKLHVPMRDVVEARLRDSFDKSAGKELLLLHADEGLMAWLRAIDRLRFFGISFNDCVCYLLRSAMIRVCDHDAWFPHVVDCLEEPWRSRLQKTRRYEILHRMNKTARQRGRAVWPFSPPEDEKGEISDG